MNKNEGSFYNSKKTGIFEKVNSISPEELKKSNVNIYQKYFNEKVKSNCISPEELKKSQDYIDKFKKLNPEYKF